MSKQLSQLYREALKLQAPATRLDAEQLQALTEGRLQGEALDAALERLAAEPEAPALLAFAHDAEQQSKLLALELRRADAVARSWARPYRRHRLLAAAAAVMAMALLVPLALRDHDRGHDDVALPSTLLEVDRHVILVSSFDEGGSAHREAEAAGSNGNAAIFHNRFDG